MTQKQIQSLLEQGEPLTIKRVANKKIAGIVLSVKVKYFIGKTEITREKFESAKAKNKLFKDLDKSTSSICIFKLRR